MNNKYYPEHVAIILDGNRRWAKDKGLPSLK
jgi:undecaprenyl diphosphate synthase